MCGIRRAVNYKASTGYVLNEQIHRENQFMPERSLPFNVRFPNKVYCRSPSLRFLNSAILLIPFEYSLSSPVRLMHSQKSIALGFRNLENASRFLNAS